MDKQLLDILVCPVTGAAVGLAERALLDELNARIEAGDLYYVDGTPVTERLSAALVTADRASLYRVNDDIPMMVAERAIELAPRA